MPYGYDFPYYNLPSWFFRNHVDLRSFVASTSKRRKKKPSWNTRKKKRKWPPKPIETVKFKRNIINSILHSFRKIINSLSKKGSGGYWN